MMDAELDLLLRDVDSLKSRLEALRAKPLEMDPILTLDEIEERFKVGRAAILAAERRKELKVSRGPRKRIQVKLSELERWLEGDNVASSHDDDEERAKQLRAYLNGGDRG